MNTTATTRSPQRETFLAEIIITAVEGGINGWAAVEDYRWNLPGLDGGTAATGPNGGGNAHVTVSDAEDPDDEQIRVDLEAIASAVTRIASDDEVRYLSRNARTVVKTANRQNTTAPDQGEDIDAQIADEILQVAAFGEVVFG